MSFPPPSKKQAQVMWFSLTALAVAVVLALTGLMLWGVGWVLHRLSAVLLPLALALIMAYILNPVVEYFQRKKLPRLWSICLVFVLGIVIFAALLSSVLPGLIDESRKLATDLPNLVEQGRAKVERLLADSRLIRFMPPEWQHTVQTPQTTNGAPTNSITNGLSTNLDITVLTSTNLTAPKTNQATIRINTEDLKKALNVPAGESAVPPLTRGLVVAAKWMTNQLSKLTTWAEFLIGFILVPVYLFYFLLEKDGITRQWTDYLPIKESAAKNEIVFVLEAINDCMIVFFRGQVLVALCVGVLLASGYALLGLNYAVLLGVVAGVLGIVPYLGTITSLALALTVAAIQFGDWSHPLLVIALAAVVKLLEDFIISPRIIGKRAGLHPLTIILAVLIGTTLLGGFIGAMVAIPLTAALRTLMFRYIWTREHSGKKMPRTGP